MSVTCDRAENTLRSSLFVDNYAYVSGVRTYIGGVRVLRAVVGFTITGSVSARAAFRGLRWDSLIRYGSLITVCRYCVWDHFCLIAPGLTTFRVHATRHRWNQRTDGCKSVTGVHDYRLFGGVPG